MKTLDNRNGHARKATPLTFLTGAAGLLAVACTACGSPDANTAAASLAEARSACNLDRPEASELRAASLTVLLPAHGQDYSAAVSSLSCLSGKLGGPADFGDRVMYGTRPSGSAKWADLTVNWNLLNGRPDGGGVLSIGPNE
ncbi:hypothetical protein GCM10027053_15730 [Intrasporangium mesophilum]